MRHSLATVLLAGATAYCAQGEFARGAGLQQPSPPDRGQAVTMTRLASGSEPLTQQSGISESTRLVVRDAATWAQVWERIWTVRPAPARPAIDFNREMVVVAALGTRFTGGYGIALESASPDAGSLQVVIRIETPGSDCLLSQILTAPVDVARMPRTEQPVTFRERNVTRGC